MTDVKTNDVTVLCVSSAYETISVAEANLGGTRTGQDALVRPHIWMVAR